MGALPVAQPSDRRQRPLWEYLREAATDPEAHYLISLYAECRMPERHPGMRANGWRSLNACAANLCDVGLVARRHRRKARRLLREMDGVFSCVLHGTEWFRLGPPPILDGEEGS